METSENPSGGSMAQGDRTLLTLGVVGLILTIAAGLYIPCPTMGQQHQLQIALALASAAIGASIPGLLQVNIGASKTVVRAGGALAVFLVVFWFNPASWTDERVDRSFSNASCQGVKPTAVFAPKSSVPPEIRPENARPITPEQALGRPVRFSFDYKFGAHAGIRTWTQVRPGVWTEAYPDPSIITVFTEVGRETVDECLGTVVAAKDNSIRVFIPDKGCKLMWTRFQAGDTSWQWLGAMKDVA